MTVEVLIIQQLCKVEETKSKALAGICKAPFYTVNVRDPLLALLVVRAATKVQTCSHAKKKINQKMEREQMMRNHSSTYVTSEKLFHYLPHLTFPRNLNTVLLYQCNE